MLIGYMRVSTDGDRQVLDLQRDALLAVGVDEQHLFEDRVSGSRDDRTAATTPTAVAIPITFSRSSLCSAFSLRRASRT